MIWQDRRDGTVLIRAVGRPAHGREQAAWLGLDCAPWADPIFPAASPGSARSATGRDRILGLREQPTAMDEPPLTV
jgi:hypothetical protein